MEQINVIQQSQLPDNQNGKQEERKKLKRKLLIIILILLGLLLLIFGTVVYLYTQSRIPYFGVYREDILVRIPIEELPDDTLYVTETRRYYERGKMTLVIPSIGVYTSVGESTTPKGLQEMPGLYEFSQMPGEGDINVSIAGHRDIHDMVFYDLHKVSDNDYLYLLYNGTVYQYRYVDTKIVKPDNWDIIKPQGFSCLTLTTCDPIGTALNRLIVRGELIGFQPLDDKYQFIDKEAAS